MDIKERARYLAIDCDFNCAETITRLADERYGLGLSDDALKMLCGFGGGMACGSTCGVLAGSVAVLGRMIVEGQAHKTDEFKERVAAFVEKFTNDLGGRLCDELKPKYHVDDENVRCLETIERGMKCLEEYVDSIGAAK